MLKDVVRKIFNFISGGELTRAHLWDEALTAAEKGDLAAVRTFFSHAHVKADLASHPFRRFEPHYVEFLTIAAQKNNLELAQFIFDQGIRPRAFTMEDLKKEGVDNAVTALLDKHVVILYPKKDRNVPKP
jgi:hypothetical protein